MADAQMIAPKITVKVTPRYLPEQSDMLQDRYAFAYHVLIENESTETVTLRQRYWRITDAQGRVQEVSGAGVVGKEPVLEPWETFEYSSGAQLRTPWGMMQGHYEFELVSGERFEVPIERFDLRSDVVLQ